MALLKLENLTKTFPIQGGFFGRIKGHVQAVNEINLTVEDGEILGLVGESGCGKSTLGRTILKLYEPDSGRIYFEDQDITHYSIGQMRPLRKRMQIIFQDPYASLNPRMTIGSTLAEPLIIHHVVPRHKLQDRVAELLEMVGLSADAINKYPHEFSGGQRQRVGIARALALEPKLVIADEPVSALDVSIQAQIINLLSDLKERFGLAMIFIAHDLKVVEHLSQRIVVMYLGRIMEIINSDELNNALHPYTVSLLSAIPTADPYQKNERIILKGDVPSPIHPPSGCVFHTRCPKATEECKQGIPPLTERKSGHFVACIHV